MFLMLPLASTSGYPSLLLSGLCPGICHCAGGRQEANTPGEIPAGRAGLGLSSVGGELPS